MDFGKSDMVFPLKDKNMYSSCKIYERLHTQSLFYWQDKR